MPVLDPCRTRRATVAAVVFDARGRILLHRRADTGTWCLPGGAIESDESAPAATARRVRDFTGLAVEPFRLVGLYSSGPTDTTHSDDVGSGGSGAVERDVEALFECRATGGELHHGERSLSVGWFDPKDLPEPFLTDHAPRLRDALAREPQAFFS
jgi:ADP-ribose pyrophosphatase YjhB (NUDIX family)